MVKLVAVLVIGLGLGAGAVLLVTGFPGQPDAPPTASPATQGLGEPPATRTDASNLLPKPLAEIQALPSEFERNSTLYALLQSSHVGTVEDLLEEAEDLTNPWQTKRIIYSRYAQLDVHAALKRLRAEERLQSTLIPSAVSALAGRDLDAALAFIETLDERLQRRSAMAILGLDGLSDAGKEQVARRFSLEPYLWRLQARDLAKNNPAEAWQLAFDLEKGQERNQTLWSVAYTWFETDPSAALSALGSLESTQRGAWQDSLLKRWAAQDRGAALDWALAQPWAGEEIDPVRQVAAAIAEDSPREMLNLAGTLDASRRDEISAVVIRAWGKNDPAAALDALKGMANAKHLYRTTGLAIVNSWANNDPRAAFEWVRAEGSSPMLRSTLARTLGNLGRADPLVALTLADELDGITRTQAIARVLGAWGKEDPRAAAAWLDSSGTQAAHAVHAVALHYAEVYPEEAFAWLQGQSIEAQRGTVPMVVGRIAAESPETALRLINRIRDSIAKQSAESGLVATWVDTDPRAAVRAIARMDPSMSQEHHRRAFDAWSRFDRQGAMAFLNQVPASDRDSAIQGMLEQTLSAGETDVAERLYDRLSSAEGRRQAASTLYFRLRESDPPRAERYRELLGATVHEDGSITYHRSDP